jgi:hypothetical protein
VTPDLYLPHFKVNQKRQSKWRNFFFRSLQHPKLPIRTYTTFFRATMLIYKWRPEIHKSSMPSPPFPDPFELDAFAELGAAAATWG